MICIAKRHNVINGVLHYAGAVAEFEAVPNDNWRSLEAQATEEPPATEEEAAAEDLELHTVAKLRELATARGIETTSRTTKSELLELLG